VTPEEHRAAGAAKREARRAARSEREAYAVEHVHRLSRSVARHRRRFHRLRSGPHFYHALWTLTSVRGHLRSAIARLDALRCPVGGMAFCEDPTGRVEAALRECEAEAEEWRRVHGESDEEVDYASGLLSAVVDVRAALGGGR
jgi:hypothetical protein